MHDWRVSNFRLPPSKNRTGGIHISRLSQTILHSNFQPAGKPGGVRCYEGFTWRPAGGRRCWRDKQRVVFSDHSGAGWEQVYSPMEGRHWTRLLSPARWYKLCWPRQRGKTPGDDWLVVGLTSLGRTDLLASPPSLSPAGRNMIPTTLHHLISSSLTCNNQYITNISLVTSISPLTSPILHTTHWPSFIKT